MKTKGTNQSRCPLGICLCVWSRLGGTRSDSGGVCPSRTSSVSSPLSQLQRPEKEEFQCKEFMF